MGEEDDSDEVEPGGPQDLDYLAGERTSRPTAAERREEAEGLTRPLGDPDEAAHRSARGPATAPVAGREVRVPVQPRPQDREQLPRPTEPAPQASPTPASGAAEAGGAGTSPRPHGPQGPPPQARG
ncbi:MULTISPECIES: hypothetical protein [unclassified Streptomyces]|uniref:hypothetical protein n=1 Tax=unclassified Streptomyces TaxID=2593676 RepID=UPI00081ECBE5|nr:MULTISPECIES: hypothetical protein [unclassified Streptomyces]MYR27820.1 hypothetical protein [Streptomyces sp. SID4945]SCF29775.1 hypothetical protein GA0115257_110345 [Streptomyces sp. LcepLS]